MAVAFDDDRASMLTLDVPPNASASTFSLGTFAGSQLTLVDRPDAAAVLVFTADSHLNSTVALHGRPIYRFRSNKVGTKTSLYRIGLDGAEELIVVNERRLLGSVLVRPDGEKLKVSKYIRPVKTGTAYASTFAFDFMGTTYEWRIDMLGKKAFYTQGAPMLEPLAWHNRSKKAVENGRGVIRPAALGMKEEATQPALRDQILISWMVVNEISQTLQVGMNRGSGYFVS